MFTSGLMSHAGVGALAKIGEMVKSAILLEAMFPSCLPLTYFSCNLRFICVYILIQRNLVMSQVSIQTYCGNIL